MELLVLILVFVLGIFMLYNNDIILLHSVHPNFFQYIFTTIHCDTSGDEFKDHLIILQSFHNQLVEPFDGYDIINENVFLDMFNQNPHSLGVNLCTNTTGIPNFKEPAVYIIEYNKTTYTVHPYLVDIIFEMFGIND